MNPNEKNKTGKRVIRKMLIGLAWLATIIALFYAEEDWRGAHEWNHYRQQLEANGAQLDLAAFIPKPVPDNQNFAAIPVIESWFTQRTNFDKKWADNYALASSMIGSESNPPAPEGKQGGERYFLDLVAWKMAFVAIESGRTDSNQQFASGKLDLASRASAAPVVLADLASSETELDQLRAASDRPYARYPVIYDMDDPWGVLLPHLGNVKRTVQRLQLRTCAELAASQSDHALADVKLMLYLADSVRTEPFLISYLVRLACVHLAIQPVWEGLAEHAWSDSQLQELQARFQQYDFVTDLKRPLDSERAAGMLTIELTQKNGIHYWEDINNSSGTPAPSHHRIDKLIDSLVPRGWYDQEKLSYCRLFDLLLRSDLDSAKRQVLPKEVESNKDKLEQALAKTKFNRAIHHQIVASVLLPALGGVPKKAAMAQTAVDEAAIACALERYRLANGQFPENLGALVPKFISQLPNDVIAGESYKYHRATDGQFVLYSIGWNEKDDGGVPGQTLFDDKNGDWVWQYPPK
jgi:hypothetical protein